MADVTYITERMAQIVVSHVNTSGAMIKPYTPIDSPNGSWATYAGGEKEADDGKTRPGGMGSEKSVGGPPSRGDITLTTQLTDFNWGWIDELDGLVGEEFQVGVNYMRRDKSVARGVDPNSGFSRRGTLKTVTPPDLDANGNATTFLTIIVSCHED